MSKGCRYVALLSASGCVSKRDQALLDNLCAHYNNLQLHVFKADVSSLESLKSDCVDRLPTLNFPPIKHVGHAATVYAASAAINVQSLGQTWEVKVTGALNLKALLSSSNQGEHLSFVESFVFFTTLGGVHGSTDHVQYTAAQATLAALAEKWRISENFPALAIDFPIVAGSGRLSQLENVEDLHKNVRGGFSVVSFSRIEGSLEKLIANISRFPAHVSLDCPRWSAYHSLNRNFMIFDDLEPVYEAERKAERRAMENKGAGGATTGAPNMINGATTGRGVGSRSSHSSEEVKDLVFQKVAFTLGCEADEIAPDVQLTEVGVDSLASIGLSNWISSEFGLTISQTEFLAGITPGQIIARVITHVGAVGGRTESDETTASSSPSSDTPTNGSPRSWENRLSEYRPPISSRTLTPPRRTTSQQSTHLTREAIQKRRSALESVSGSSGSTCFTPEKIDETTNQPTLPARTENQPQSLIDSMLSSVPLPNDFGELIDYKKLLLQAEERSRKHAGGEQENRENISTTIKIHEHLDEALEAGLEQKIRKFGLLGKKVLVFRAKDANFCTGMNLSKNVSFKDGSLSSGLERFKKIYEQLQELSQPTIVVCTGATRGGGMLFPSMGTITLATKDATFGFPEVRRGALPGLVSVAAQKRLSKTQAQRLMLTGDAISADEAKQLGLVDYVGEDLPAVEKELKRLLGRFVSVGEQLLGSCLENCPASSMESAMVAMGGLDEDRRSAVDRADDGEPEEDLVLLRFCRKSNVGIVLLNDKQHCNALDTPITKDLKKLIAYLKRRREFSPGREEDVVADHDQPTETVGEQSGTGTAEVSQLKGLVIIGNGAHYCVGANPYSFARATARVPTTTAAFDTYQMYKAAVDLRTLGVPLITAVHGRVVGGGLALMLNCDYRVSAESTTFSFGNLPRGVCPGMLLSENLVKILGVGETMDLYLNDWDCSADECRKLGLLHDVVGAAASRGDDVDLAQRHALSFALSLAGFPSLGLQKTLELLRPEVDLSRLAKECVGMAECLGTGTGWLRDGPEMILFQGHHETGSQPPLPPLFQGSPRPRPILFSFSMP